MGFFDDCKREEDRLQAQTIAAWKQADELFEGIRPGTRADTVRIALALAERLLENTRRICHSKEHICDCGSCDPEWIADWNEEALCNRLHEAECLIGDADDDIRQLDWGK